MVKKYEKKASWIVEIGVAIEEIHDDLQHRFKKAYFFTWNATEVADALALQNLLTPLLEVKSTLPRRMRLVPGG